MVSAKSASSERGFGLIEVSVSVFLLGVAAIGVAQLFALAALANLSAKGQTSTAVLASQKMEQLRSLSWGFEVNADGTIGAPISDTVTDVSQDPPIDGGRGLLASPAGTLDTNTPGYVDFLDQNGNWVGTGANPVPGTVYIRRWAIEPLPANPDTLVLQVVVTTLRRDQRKSAGAVAGGRLLDDTRLTSVKTRRAV